MRLGSLDFNTIEYELSAFLVMIANPKGAVVVPDDVKVPRVVLRLNTQAGIL